MTRLGRWIRNFIEWFLRRYYEGPDAPPRLAQNVTAFAALHPHATVAEWMEFSSRFANECYRTGYVRGLEWAERDLDRRDPVDDPEVLLDKRDNDWSWVNMAPNDEEMRRIVSSNPYDHLSPEERLLALDSVGRYYGTHRIVMIPVRDTKRR
jgi:hypothetical protein